MCVGNVGTVPRLGLNSYCMQDSPVGIRFADWVSVFPSGQTTAATFDRGLMYQRGLAIGQENRAKGVTVILGPVGGPLGRAPAGGRNWEGFSPDPVLTGVGMAETIKGIQDAGVIATAKHFILQEQGEQAWTAVQYEVPLVSDGEDIRALPSGRRGTTISLQHHRVLVLQCGRPNTPRALSLALCRRRESWSWRSDVLI